MLDTRKFRPLNTENGSGVKRKKGGILTIVCSPKNGKRLMLSSKLVEMLEIGEEASVQIGFVEKNLVLGKKLPGDKNTYRLYRQGKKYVIYSAEVVQEISRVQGIAFETRVSYTWTDVKFDDYEGDPVAFFEPERGRVR